MDLPDRGRIDKLAEVKSSDGDDLGLGGLVFGVLRGPDQGWMEYRHSRTRRGDALGVGQVDRMVPRGPEFISEGNAVSGRGAWGSSTVSRSM
jgi:hypothetical protein